jgi:hypothetical protein
LVDGSRATTFEMNRNQAFELRKALELVLKEDGEDE